MLVGVGTLPSGLMILRDTVCSANCGFRLPTSSISEPNAVLFSWLKLITAIPLLTVKVALSYTMESQGI